MDIGGIPGMVSSRRSRFDRGIRRSRRGNAMLELAIALPVLILIAIGVMDYGRIYFTSIAVSNAARAAAEWGSFGSAGIAFDNTKQQQFGMLDGSEVSGITVTASTTCKCQDADVSCSATGTCSGYGAQRVFVKAVATKTVALLIKYPGIPTSFTVADTVYFRAQ